MSLTVEEIRDLGGYSVIHADPPWPYRRSKGNGAAENHYPTMRISDIKKLPVEAIAGRDSLLFMWGTWPNLPEALEVIGAWGYTYKTAAFVWVKRTINGKQAFGGGNYTRANSEVCFLATRGKGTSLVHDRTVRQVIEDPEDAEGFAADTLITTIDRHSAKPIEARTRIEQLIGVVPPAKGAPEGWAPSEVPRIELFAREPVKGWDVFGNEVLSDVDLSLPE